MSSSSSSMYPRTNIIGGALKPCSGVGPTTGFFRNNYCDATPLDGASHTVAAVVSTEFLEFSASRGNDLRPLLSQGDTWCLCAKRWNEAVQASVDHELGDRIVPRVIVDCTHEKAAEVIGSGGKELLLKFAATPGNMAAVCEKKDGLTAGQAKRMV